MHDATLDPTVLCYSSHGPDFAIGDPVVLVFLLLIEHLSDLERARGFLSLDDVVVRKIEHQFQGIEKLIRRIIQIEDRRKIREARQQPASTQQSRLLFVFIVVI